MSSPGPLALLLQALATTRALLGGPAAKNRRRALAVLAIMAGLVGAGTAPPPFGLLQPVWENADTRKIVFGNPGINAALAALCVFLVLMGGFGRSFTLGFLEGLASGQPEVGAYRRWLKQGALHYLWSSALSIPLYAVLYYGEWNVSRAGWDRLVNAPAAETNAAMFAWAFQFLGVLLPWTLLTLPIMVFAYELTPAAMLSGGGPAQAAGRVMRVAGRRPGPFAGYIGVRMLLQAAGNTLAGIALVPCTLVAGIVSSPIWGGGMALSNALGGFRTSPGAAMGAVAIMLSLAVLYCALCVALLPVSVFLNAYALHAVTAWEAGTKKEAGPQAGPALPIKES